MSYNERAESYVARLIRQHPVGTVPSVATFQTAEDVDLYIEQTQEANREGLKRLRAARERSLEKAKSQRIG